MKKDDCGQEREIRANLLISISLRWQLTGIAKEYGMLYYFSSVYVMLLSIFVFFNERIWIQSWPKWIGYSTHWIQAIFFKKIMVKYK